MYGQTGTKFAKVSVALPVTLEFAKDGRIRSNDPIVSQHSYGPEVVSTDMAEEGHGQRTDVWWTSLSLVPMSGLACPILPEGRRGSLGSTLITVDLIHSFELSLGPMCEFL